MKSGPFYQVSCNARVSRIVTQELALSFNDRFLGGTCGCYFGSTLYL
jgi:hypothetical protein